MHVIYDEHRSYSVRCIDAFFCSSTTAGDRKEEYNGSLGWGWEGLGISNHCNCRGQVDRK